MALTLTMTVFWWAAALGPVLGYTQWEVLLIFNRFGEAIWEGALFHLILAGQIAFSAWWLAKGMDRRGP